MLKFRRENTALKTEGFPQPTAADGGRKVEARHIQEGPGDRLKSLKEEYNSSIREMTDIDIRHGSIKAAKLPEYQGLNKRIQNILSRIMDIEAGQIKPRSPLEIAKYFSHKTISTGFELRIK